jgi:hypothetical protein
MPTGVVLTGCGNTTSGQRESLSDLVCNILETLFRLKWTPDDAFRALAFPYRIDVCF